MNVEEMNIIKDRLKEENGSGPIFLLNLLKKKSMHKIF